MTTYTQSDLAIRILKDLGVVAAEETPSATDMQWAYETIQAEVEALTAENIPLWGGSYASIPGQYFTPLSARIGLAVMPSFGLAGAADVAVGLEAANRRLRKLSAVRGTGEVEKSQYY